jgi:hypothetical protein
MLLVTTSRETTNRCHVKSNNIAERSFLQLMLVIHVNNFFFIYLEPNNYYRKILQKITQNPLKPCLSGSFHNA